ncbi:MAG TPA: hypothetical protein DDZ51_21270 [Planctomycetaceae bacterium]|nr:hypothetical protein [Planctomycetaceae bacterium]
MERDRIAALRRVAIVLSSLPDATARRLLASLEPDHQRSVRAAISHLDDVDPLERRRALDGFTHSIRHGRSSLAGENDAAEIVLSRVALHRDDARLSDRSQGNFAKGSDGTAGDSSAFAFLSTVDDDAIAHRIKEEHPQTIAIVLAAVAPRQAARLLAKLGVALRAETMRRLAKMDDPPTEVVEEIAAQLKQKLVHGNGQRHGAVATGDSTSGTSASGQPRSPGQAALQAILAEMNQANGSSPVGGEYSATGRMATHSSEHSVLGRGSSFEGVSRRHTDNSVESSSAPVHRSDEGNKLNEKIAPIAKSNAEVHSQLISTPPAKLREALASVDGRQAILTLCGLPKAVAEAVLNDLPRRQAKQIRQQIASFAMVELREIDAAKEAVAKAILPPENRSPARVPPRPVSPSSMSPGPMATPSATLAAA